MKDLACAAASVLLPTPTGLARHVFADEKRDYYEIADGLPQHQCLVAGGRAAA
jgi:hypothetical protein